MSNAARRKERLGYLERRRQRVRHRTLTRQSLTLFSLAFMVALLLWTSLQA
jgi:hypothetical protein